MAKRQKARRNITRIKDMKNRRDEFWVRVQRSGEQICSRHFYDSDYGDSRIALAAAQHYRDQMLAENPKMNRQDTAQIKRRSNASGIIGVQKIVRENEVEGKAISYRVRWIPKKGGKRVSRTFTVAEYGDKAEQMAIEARIQGVTEMSEN